MKYYINTNNSKKYLPAFFKVILYRDKWIAPVPRLHHHNFTAEKVCKPVSIPGSMYLDSPGPVYSLYSVVSRKS